MVKVYHCTIGKVAKYNNDSCIKLWDTYNQCKQQQRAEAGYQSDASLILLVCWISFFELWNQSDMKPRNGLDFIQNLTTFETYHVHLSSIYRQHFLRASSLLIARGMIYNNSTEHLVNNSPTHPSNASSVPQLATLPLSRLRKRIVEEIKHFGHFTVYQ